MKAYLELLRDVVDNEEKSYRTTGFVFRYTAIAGKIFPSARFEENITSKWGFFSPLDVMEGLRKSFKRSAWTIRCALILKDLSLLLSSKVAFLLFLKIRNSPSLFSSLRNKLIPTNDGKTDSVAYESKIFFSFLYPNYRNHFYGESKNFVGSRREEFEAGYFRA